MENFNGFKKLHMGKYNLKEITTIDGAVLDETEHKVVFEQKDTVTKEYIVESNIENKKIEVPKTGDESKIKLFAGLILLSLLAIVYIVIKNHKKNK